MSDLKPGDVVQINADSTNPHFIGLLFFVTEVKKWGARVALFAPSGIYYYRATFEEMERIGEAAMIPEGVGDD